MTNFKFDINAAGHLAKSDGYGIIELLPEYNNQLFAAAHPNFVSGWQVQNGGWAILTGFYQQNETTGQSWWQIESNPYYGVTRSMNSDFHWTLYDEPYQTHTVADAQKFVDGIIRNNKHIYENNLLCAHYKNKFTKAQQQQIIALQQRLEKRNKSLQENSGVLFNKISTSYPKGYINFYDDLKALTSGYDTIGAVVSTTALIVIGAIVLASAGTAAYFAYKAYYAESVQDVKYSDELTKILQSKLTQDEYEQLTQETAGLITKAKIQQRLDSFGGTAKTLLAVSLGIALAYGAYKIINK